MSLHTAGEGAAEGLEASPRGRLPLPLRAAHGSLHNLVTRGGETASSCPPHTRNRGGRPQNKFWGLSPFEPIMLFSPPLPPPLGL